MNLKNNIECTIKVSDDYCFRPNVEELKSHLKDLGANYVVTEEDLKTSEMKETMKVGLALRKYLFKN